MRALIKMAAVTGAAIAALAVLPAVSASADDGNSRANCSSGEICFWYDGTSRFQKQFWNTGNHGGNNFMDTINGGYRISNQPVQDNALEVTNRDTVCDVRVGNLQGGVWAWVTIPNNGERQFLGTINNRNDRHERIGPGCS